MKRDSDRNEKPFIKFGVATKDITPKKPLWLDGYFGRARPYVSVREPLSLGCLAVSDGTKTVLLFCIDSLGLQHSICLEIFSMLEREVGIDYPDVMLSCSHTHFAPAMRWEGFAGVEGYFISPDQEYLEDLFAKILAAAKESISNMKVGVMETARTYVPQVHFNRRTRRKSDGRIKTSFLYPSNPEELDFSPVDSELFMLRFKDESGVRAVLANFACHPVVNYGERAVSEDMISADFPHYMRETIRAAYGCPALFSLGAAGDVVPMDRYVENRRVIGEILGNSVVLSERRFKADESAKIATASIALKAKTRRNIDSEEAEREFYKLMAEHGPKLFDPEKPAGSQIYGTPEWEKYNPVIAHYYESKLYGKSSFDIPIQFMRIGESVMVSLPFEVLSEIGIEMKKSFPNSVLVSCANGYNGYLPMKHEFDRGGYEISAPAMHFAPDTGDRVLEAILQKLKSF
ncbi:MAG TPA: hypothetical protein PK821_01780 [Victivallales bacterium]|nr:hypothetical protein [Victivallales bacterium]